LLRSRDWAILIPAMRASLTVLLHKVLSLNPFTPMSGAHGALRSRRVRSNVCGATGVVLVLLRMVTVEVEAQDFTYTTNNDTITITGYNGPGGAVTIPSTIFGLPVTSIGYEAFSFRATLTSITIPDSVTFIGGSAFQGTGLTSVTIPIGVTNIGDYAFDYCSSLTNLTIRDSATSIGDWTFAFCTSLASVTMGKNVTSIGAATFAWCTNLTSVLIPNSVRNLADGAETKGGGIGAFNGCASLTNVTIGNSVTNIGNFVFSAPACPMLRFQTAWLGLGRMRSGRARA
jgi:hypothetical protein